MQVNGTSNHLELNVSDLYTIASDIDLLELEYKETLVNSINSLDKDSVLTDISLRDTNGNYIDLATICSNISKSQSIVDKGKKVYKTYQGALTADTKQTAVTVNGATANNLSVGARAWVDGHYIEGNGADNKAYYDKGYQDGINYANSSYKVIYTYHSHGDGYCNKTPKYHTHTGNTISGGTCYATPKYHTHTGNSTNGGGCYMTPVYHTHSGSSTAGGGCYGTPVYHTHNGDASQVGGCYEEQICGAAVDFDVDPEGQDDDEWKCDGYWSVKYNKKKWHYFSHDPGSWCPSGTGNIILTCGSDETVLDHYDLNCGKTTSTIDSYSLNCGKTPSTIDSYILSCSKTNTTVDSYYCSIPEGTITSATVKFY